MGAFLRSVFGIVVGLVLALIILTGIELLSSRLFPLPPGVDPMDPEQLRAIADQIPIGAFVMILVAWGTAAFVGAWLAGRIARRSPLVHGMIVAVLLMLAGIANMLMIPHPVWVWVLGIAAFLGFGYLGSKLAERTM